MNREQEKIETSLKKFQDITFNENEKREVHSKMMERIEKPIQRNWKWDIRPVLSFAVVGLLLLGGGYFLTQQIINSEETQQADEKEEMNLISPYEELEKEVAEKLGGPVFIPYDVGIPLRSAIMLNHSERTDEEKVIIGDPLVVSFGYSHAQIEKEDFEEFAGMKERSGDELMLLYGHYIPYEKQDVQFGISNKELLHIDTITLSLMGEERIIEGMTVYYRETKYMEVPSIRIGFEIDNFIYGYTFHLEKMTEDQAIQFVTKAIKQINHKRNQ
ncbi:hypothetical protein [Sutcliffiella cohnii]|uniref:hypothetical protein n=1 Tax=Sutcliffiella cohnii TaxID=33932 RepID=UPI002E1DBB95|nr:hypothetical protein [Sutcliffiella cohnii]